MYPARSHEGEDVQRLLGRERAIVGFFAFQFFCLIYLQKFGLPFGVTKLPLLIPLMYGGIAVMALTMRLQVSAVRLLFYALFFAAVLFSQSQVMVPYSQPSMIITLMMYLPFVFVWRVDQAEYEKIVGIFQKLMLIPIAMVGIQLLTQVTLGMGVMPSLTPIAPKSLQLEGFNYESPYRWGQPFKRPNGLFLLEPSFVSCFIGAALVLELTFFRRLRWMATYVVALMATVATTGQLLVALALPFVIRKQSPRLIFVAVLAGVLGGVAMLGTGKGVEWDRLGEFSSTNTSGYSRLIAPFLQLTDALTRPNYLFTGAGAGNINHSTSAVWAVTKLTYEYGVAAALCFMALIVASIWKSPTKGLAFGMFIIVNFIGGYLQEPSFMWLMGLTCCMLQLRTEADEAPSRRRLAERPAAEAGPDSVPQPFPVASKGLELGAVGTASRGRGEG